VRKVPSLNVYRRVSYGFYDLQSAVLMINRWSNAPGRMTIATFKRDGNARVLPSTLTVATDRRLPGLMAMSTDQTADAACTSVIFDQKRHGERVLRTVFLLYNCIDVVCKTRTNIERFVFP